MGLKILLAFSFFLGILYSSEKPNIIFILVDDMGWSDLGCYGSEIETPNLDSLAQNGVRFTQFYNTAKCMTSRGCLLTGLYAQQAKTMGALSTINGATLGEVLKTAGYRTLASGKHHGGENLKDRGFDHYYGLRDGCSNFWNPGDQRANEPVPARKKVRVWCDDEKTLKPYTPENKAFYTTDAFTNKALEWLEEEELKEKPFFLYLAYTAPHYPLHAWPKDIEKYKGVYDIGYEATRTARYRRQVELGLINSETSPLPQWEGGIWNELPKEEQEKEILRMQIYAAMMDSVDQNVGKLLAKLKEQKKLNNTLIMFASDNGGCAEVAKPKVRSTKIEDFGKVNSYECVGRNWATVQNTPLKKWKNYSHEGGIRTPLIVSWPSEIKNVGSFSSEVGHLIDIMPTLVNITGATYPKSLHGKQVIPMQGVSLLPSFSGRKLTRAQPLFWKWARGKAIRRDQLKAVRWGKEAWELYDMSKSPNEQTNLAESKASELKALTAIWESWEASVK